MKIRREDIVPNLIVRSTTHGEVLIMGYPNGPVVQVQAFRLDGSAYITQVRTSSLRWE